MYHSPPVQLGDRRDVPGRAQLATTVSDCDSDNGEIIELADSVGLFAACYYWRL